MRFRAKVIGTLLIPAALLAGCGGGSDRESTPDQSTTSVAATGTEPTAPMEPTDSGSTSPPSSSPSTQDTATATDGTATVASEAAESSEAEALAFFRSTETACAEHADRTGNSPVDGVRFTEASVLGQTAGGAWIIEDGMGDRLLLDLDSQVVYGEDGPEGVLPMAYSFGCPEDLYLGSSHD